MPPRRCAPAPKGHEGAASQPGGARASGAARRRASLLFGVVEAPVRLQAIVAAVQQFLELEVADLAQGVAERALERGAHRLRIAVRAAHRLVDDLVDQA